MKSILLVLAAAGSMVMAGAAYAQAGADLAKSKGCLGCHDVAAKKVGPAFKDVAAKYKGNKEAEAKLVTALKEGTGHPSKVAATDAELKTLVQYVLTGK
jgi:cytochrome c